MVEEARKHGCLLRTFSTKEDKNYDFLVTTDIMIKITASKTPQGVAAICSRKKTKKVWNRILALDNIQDPGNLGTLIRTAASFGFTDVIVKGVDMYNSKVITASQGALFEINVIQTKDISEYFEGFTVIGALLDKTATDIKKLETPEKFVLVLGNEGRGISEEIIEKLDERVYIPINFESLNVATAGSILMYELSNV